MSLTSIRVTDGIGKAGEIVIFSNLIGKLENSSLFIHTLVGKARFFPGIDLV